MSPTGRLLRQRRRREVLATLKAEHDEREHFATPAIGTASIAAQTAALAA
jgi:hypothetical protein